MQDFGSVQALAEGVVMTAGLHRAKVSGDGDDLDVPVVSALWAVSPGPIVKPHERERRRTSERVAMAEWHNYAEAGR
jgi:hypothetical protein